MNNPTHQDWTPVVLKKAPTGPKAGGGGGGGGGGGMKTSTGMSAAKLEAETEELKHKTVDKEMSQRIIAARVAKKMNQKDLATACMIDISIVQSYENGKAIPNQAIITKIEKALGAKIRPPKK